MARQSTVSKSMDRLRAVAMVSWAMSVLMFCAALLWRYWAERALMQHIVPDDLNVV